MSTRLAAAQGGFISRGRVLQVITKLFQALIMIFILPGNGRRDESGLQGKRRSRSCKGRGHRAASDRRGRVNDLL